VISTWGTPSVIPSSLNGLVNKWVMIALRLSTLIHQVKQTDQWFQVRFGGYILNAPSNCSSWYTGGRKKIIGIPNILP